MSVTGWIDRVQRRFPVLGFPIAVIYKFADDMGGYLAALIAYYAFVSLFPLFLLASTVLSIVLRNYPELQEKLINSALSEFPVIGDQIKVPSALSGSPIGVTLGTLAALYGALGAAQAFQYAANTAWQVPRNNRPNPIKARGRSITLLGVLGLGLILTTALSTVVSKVVGGGTDAHIAVIVGTLIINTGLFILAFQIASTHPAGPRQLWPGAVISACVWQALQVFGSLYVERVIRHSSATNGVFATVLGLLAFLYLFALALVITMEIDVVRELKLYPRALLTPFTDAVDLTAGDKAAYRGQAEAARSKGFEQIDVRFDKRE